MTRLLLCCAAIATLGAALPSPERPVVARIPHGVDPVEMTVYKTPSCGCCKKWVSYIEAAGYKVKTVDQDNLTQLKADVGVPKNLTSCHTALVAGYVIEGHVPAADIQRLLQERPKIVGLTAPGMPGAGPGMDTSKEPFEVLAFDAKGNTTLWARHGGAAGQ